MNRVITNRKKKPSPRDEHAENNRNKLMEEGYRLISEYGIDNVGVREISEAAGVTTGTFYYNFKDKQDLLTHYTRSRGAKAFASGHETLSGENAYERIMSFFTETMTAVLEGDGSEVVLWILMKKETSEQLYKAVYDLVCEGVQNNEFSDEKTPEELTSFILDSYRGAAFAWYRSDGKQSIRTLMQEHVGYSLEHFLR